MEKIPEVQELQFNLLNRTLGVRHASLAHQTLVEAIASVGMRARTPGSHRKHTGGDCADGLPHRGTTDHRQTVRDAGHRGPAIQPAAAHPHDQP
ncbi:hypothetical protein [Pseudomonas luteola]|uniref:hypothetical protein n=1 Tax=Pseudomonas luteola TaxID=47886 RepID=UPI0028A10E53|nr:hypothetical protein [Pseudomonas luteola]